MAKTAAEKLEKLLDKANELVAEVKHDAKLSIHTEAAELLNLWAADAGTTKEALTEFEIDAEVDASFQAGIAFAARLLAEDKLEGWF